jgi:LPXTG-motif cell wall-anchored protein
MNIQSTEAVIGDVTILGVAHLAMTAQTATVVTSTTVSAGLDNVSADGWFAGLPAGISTRATSLAGSREITLSFSGTPSASGSFPLSLSIPAGVLESGLGASVDSNLSALFVISAPLVLPVTAHFGTWIGSGGATAIIDADSELFGSLIGGDVVLSDGTHFTVSSGSTVITLKESHLHSLADGDHVLRAYFNHGWADLELTVARAVRPVDPETPVVPENPSAPAVPGSPAAVITPVRRRALARTGADMLALFAAGVAVAGGSLLVARRRRWR